MKKESSVTEILKTVIGLLATAMLAWIGNEAVIARDTLIHHTDTLAILVQTMTKMEAKLNSVPTREEVDNKFKSQRSHIDSDNKTALHASDQNRLNNQNN